MNINILNIFLEVLYEEIKRAIMALIEKIMSQILSERHLKTLAVIQSLLNIFLRSANQFMSEKVSKTFITIKE